MSVTIENDGDILYKHESKPLAMIVMGIYNEVQEYMHAYQNAPLPITGQIGKWINNARSLLIYNNCELAASRHSDDSMEFITWRLDRNGKREIGRYYNDYSDAKKDFAIRAELINQNILFSEKELVVIRSFLSCYMGLDSLDRSPVTYRQEETAKEVLSKIDTIIAPEIHEDEEKEEELGIEPELEL